MAFIHLSTPPKGGTRVRYPRGGPGTPPGGGTQVRVAPLGGAKDPPLGGTRTPPGSLSAY